MVLAIYKFSSLLFLPWFLELFLLAYSKKHLASNVSLLLKIKETYIDQRKESSGKLYEDRPSKCYLWGSAREEQFIIQLSTLATLRLRDPDLGTSLQRPKATVRHHFIVRDYLVKILSLNGFSAIRQLLIYYPLAPYPEELRVWFEIN